MAKTPIPLTLYVPPQYLEKPELCDLVAKGHQVLPLPDDLARADLLMSPNAHAWPDEFFEKPALLALALKRARQLRREP
jgi:hypothetical protein